MATGGKGPRGRKSSKTSGRAKTRGRRRHPRPGDTELPHGIVVIHEDRDILVIDKPPGLLTMGTDRDDTRTAYRVLMDYVRKGNPKSRNRVFIVHRLDRDTSGIVVFAKSEEAQQTLQEGWDGTKKTYLAVVQGRMEKDADTIVSYLAENQGRKVYSTNDASKGKLARSAYRVMKATDEFSLLEVDLLTGRKNQIRVHMADIGHPVVGDTKYGNDREHPRLALHAKAITFKHPFSGKDVVFAARVPGTFRWLMGQTGAGSDSLPPAPTLGW